MQQHTICFWTHLVVLCSFGQMSTKSVILWSYSAFKTTGNSGNKTRSNHDVSDLHIGALEKVPDLDDVFENVFSQSELVFFQSCLEV
jgi:hypothetical protein